MLSACPTATLGHSQGDSITNPVLITAFELFQPEGHWEPRNQVGSLSWAEHLVGFELETFQFESQHRSNCLTLAVLLFDRYS